uniref:Rap guanine nucleotide exchange factor like 1 n=1 Tax=Apteryx owenii TaxID=8824 RepID=A0A8B9NYS4_APTOW
MLQRCSEVQHWVGTELLLCESLGKRAHLLKKLIKIAAICKQNQDMLSFYAVVIGLNNAAISRLRLTWEKLPGKFKNLFRKFENLTDPCRNHKTYREVLAKMKPPLIPFVPLILKDLTFLHEGSKTLLDGLVNMEKLVSPQCLHGTGPQWWRSPLARPWSGRSSGPGAGKPQSEQPPPTKTPARGDIWLGSKVPQVPPWRPGSPFCSG